MISPYLTEEHQLFRESIQDFLKLEVEPHLIQWEKEGKIDRAIFKKMGDLGFLGIDAPEEYGGLNADFFYTLVFLEELGRTGDAGFGTAVAAHMYLAMNYLKKAGSKLVKEKYLVPSITGDKIGSLGMTEPFAGSDLSKIRTTAKREGDYYIVNGSKTFITNGYYGDYCVAAVKTESGISMLVIENGYEGVTTSKLDKIGLRSSDTAEMAFDNVKVPVENLLGEEGKGFGYMMTSLQTERLSLAMSNIGLMEFALEITLRYMEEREAFGKPISKFQALRHRMADLETEIEHSKQFIYYNTWLYEQGHPCVKECTMSKLASSELLKKVVDECLQMHGGYGFMNEYAIGRMYRDVRVIPIYGGTTEIMREILAKMMFEKKQYKKAY